MACIHLIVGIDAKHFCLKIYCFAHTTIVFTICAALLLTLLKIIVVLFQLFSYILPNILLKYSHILFAYLHSIIKCMIVCLLLDWHNSRKKNYKSLLNNFFHRKFFTGPLEPSLKNAISQRWKNTQKFIGQTFVYRRLFIGSLKPSLKN